LKLNKSVSPSFFLDEEIKKLETDLAYQKSFLESVRKKLSNKSFVERAPESVIANERKKEQDSILKIESYEVQIKILRNKD